MRETVRDILNVRFRSFGLIVPETDTVFLCLHISLSPRRNAISKRNLHIYAMEGTHLITHRCRSSGIVQRSGAEKNGRERGTATTAQREEKKWSRVPFIYLLYKIIKRQLAA